MQNTIISTAILLLFILTLLPDSGLGIDCFKCVSYNGSAPWCEDPFHHNFSSTILELACQAGRKGRNGVYPATSCIKIRGTFDDTGESMVIRDCSLDSGTLTTDTELVRMSHCGAFVFDNRYVIGCVQSCHENACNHANRMTPKLFSTWHLNALSIVGLTIATILWTARH